jgi:hypothetical protein
MSGLRETVKHFLDQREEYVRVLRQCVDADADYHRWQGHAEARRQLGRSLEDARIDLTGNARDEATVKAEARQQAAQSIRDEAVDEAVDGWLPLTTVIRICEEAGR